MFVCGELVGLEVLERWGEDEGGGGKCGCVDRVFEWIYLTKTRYTVILNQFSNCGRS